MRDLEIRGAGNVLGPEQSGFMLSVGYDMYLKLLEEAVLTQQGQPVPKRTDCAANLTVATSMPGPVCPPPRSSAWTCTAASPPCARNRIADDLVDELIDRYGEPPRTVNNLISVALLRGRGCTGGHHRHRREKRRSAAGHPGIATCARCPSCAGEKYKGRLLFSAGEKPYLSLRLKKGEDALRAARALGDRLCGAAGRRVIFAGGDP